MSLLNLTCLPLATQAADFVQIKLHPIDAIVQQKYDTKSVVPPLKKTSKSIRCVSYIDIDYVYDKNKEQQQKKNLQALLQRINKIQPNTIFLQAPGCDIEWFSNQFFLNASSSKE